MPEYVHSVTLDSEKCKGCTNCIKRCPTEAIRVRSGKAHIISERCIDCGECIRVCPNHAKVAVTDPFDIIYKYKYKIALPAPSFYGQFRNITDVNVILTALKRVGFDDVFEVARGAEIVSYVSRKIINEKKIDTPVISSACPAVVRLISVRFPELINNILPVLSPMEISARIAKRQATKKTGLPLDQIGVFFISPCAAKMTSIKNPLSVDKSYVDGVISMSDAYLKIVNILDEIDNPEKLACAGTYGIGWANSGGESKALTNENYIYADGINNIIGVLEEIEDGRLSRIDFVELLACTGGCVGGPLTVENSFIARTRVKKIAVSSNLNNVKAKDTEKLLENMDTTWTKKIEYMPIMKLDNDMIKAMEKMEELEKICNKLPGLDCGACGAPSCRALAEDIVRGNANEADCIFMLRRRVRELTKEMMELENTMPPSFNEGD